MKVDKAGILVFLLLLGSILQAQKINSPYSRYGLGKLSGENINTPIKAMGGISIGYASPQVINPGNPASYAVFDSTAFLFQVGLFGNITTHKTLYQSESSNFATLNYIFIGFPVTKWWRSALGILPFSKLGYDVKVVVPLEYFSNVTNDISGDGGLNRFFWGNAFKLTENLRLGIDATYLFGQAKRSSVLSFPDSVLILRTNAESKSRGSDFIFDYGLQYDLHLKNERLLTLGLIYSNTFYLKAKQEYIVYTTSGGYGTNVPVIKDTVLYQPEEKGLVILPDRVGAGFTLQQPGEWLIGADFEWQNWERFESFGRRDSLDNAWRVSLGGQFIPNHSSISPLPLRMSYRVGFRYENSYLNLFGNEINEYGISFGFGFPMKKSRTTLDLTFEFGSRGTTNDNLIKENFVNVTFGVAIFEHWFHKRKYR
jgi:hypothetical protein